MTTGATVQVTPPPRWWERSWTAIRSFEEWLDYWSAATTLEAASGLVHTLLDEERSRDPRAIRFLIELASTTHSHSEFGAHVAEPCKICQIQTQARKILVLRFLKDGTREDVFRAPTWCVTLEKDHDLLATILKFFEEQRSDLDREPAREIVRSFLMRWARHAGLWISQRDWRGPDEQRRINDLLAVRRANLEVLFLLFFRFDIGQDYGDTSPEVFAVLRKLAFLPNAAGKPPRDLDEALIWRGSGPNGVAARRLLVLRTVARGQKREQREAARER